MANEVGTEFKSSPLDVWNLILDKHHTIYADNVVSATLGKWRSMEHFLHQRNHRINMLRLAEDFEDGQGEVVVIVELVVEQQLQHQVQSHQQMNG